MSGIVPGQVLVRLKEPAGALALLGPPGRSVQEQAVRAAAGATGSRALLPGRRLHQLTVPAGTELEAVARLRARHDVLYAEPVGRVRALDVQRTLEPAMDAVPVAPAASAAPAGAPAPVVPDDGDYRYQWAPATIRLPEAWAITTGAPSVGIAILDSGVDATHPELGGRVVAAADCVDGCMPLAGSQASDAYGHGTLVAGIAAATGNNGSGVAGVTWATRLMSVRILDQHGDGSFATMVEGIAYAVAEGPRHGVKVLNLSVGGAGSGTLQSQALLDALDHAYSAGMLVVAAAGNCGRSYVTTPRPDGCAVQNEAIYPAALASAAPQRVLPVAATDRADERALFSNQSPYVALGVAAPGREIYSTAPYAVSSTGYQSGEGTSMAAPHVSGIAALAWSLHPQLSVSQVLALVKSSVVDRGAPGADQAFGAGRVDALLAVQAAQDMAGAATPTRTATPAATSTAGATATGTAPPALTPTATATPAPPATATSTATATATPAVTPASAVTARLQLRRAVAAPAPSYITDARLYVYAVDDPIDPGRRVWASSVRTDASGAFTELVAGLDGVYDFVVKPDGAVSRLVRRTVPRGTAITVVFPAFDEGDASGDDRVDDADLALLEDAFGATPGEARYDARADFDGDGRITLLDVSHLAGSWGARGPRE
jgi:subtilisin family serine protease